MAEASNKQYKPKTKSEAGAPYGATELPEGARGFMSADDGLAYVNKERKVIIDNGEVIEDEVHEHLTGPNANSEEDASPYQKVDYKKRYDDLKRHYDSKLSEFKDKEKKWSDKIRQAVPKYTPPKTLEELATFKEENPEIYDIVESVAHVRATKELEELQAEVSSLKKLASSEKAKAAYAELKALVPDVDIIRKDPQFHEWAKGQPEEIRGWIYNNSTNAALAAKAINLYRLDSGSIKDVGKTQRTVSRQDPRIAAAAAVNVSRTVDEPTPAEKVYTTSEIEAMSITEYEEKAKDIDKAYKEGRVKRA